MNIFEEKKAQLNGFEIPVECILIKSGKTAKKIENVHYHDYIEILYGIDCDTTIWCDGKNYYMKSGDLVVINSKKTHGVICKNDFNSYIVIKFMPQILYATEQSVFELKYIIPFIVDNEKYDKVFKKEEIENTEICRIFKDIMEEWDKKEYGFEIALRVYVNRIVLWLIRRWNSKHKGEKSAGIFETDEALFSIQKAIEYAQKNFVSANSMEAASICNQSYSYFSRIFKRVTKKSFTDYVNYIKITESQRLLTTTDKSITEISLDVGFSTTSYFIDRFKKQTHITPKQFRKICRDKMSSG